MKVNIGAAFFGGDFIWGQCDWGRFLEWGQEEDMVGVNWWFRGGSPGFHITLFGENL